MSLVFDYQSTIPSDVYSSEFVELHEVLEDTDDMSEHMMSEDQSFEDYDEDDFGLSDDSTCLIQQQILLHDAAQRVQEAAASKKLAEAASAAAAAAATAAEPAPAPAESARRPSLVVDTSFESGSPIEPVSAETAESQAATILPDAPVFDPSAAPEPAGEEPPLDAPVAKPTFTFNPKASSFVFNPAASTFVPTPPAPEPEVEVEDKADEKTVYDPYFLYQFQPWCYESPVELPPDIDVSLDYEYLYSSYYSIPQFGKGLARQSLLYDFEEMEYEQDLVVPTARDENRIKYDPMFMMSLKELNTARPEFLGDSEVVLGCQAPQNTPTKKKGKVATPPQEKEAPLPPLLTPKTSKKAKKKAAAAAACATPYTPIVRSISHTPGYYAETPSSSLNRSTSEPAIGGSANRWRPQRAETAEAAAAKTTRSILNKLTPENFDRLFEQLLELELTRFSILDAVLAVVVDKAVTESAFSGMYADLLLKLHSDFPNVEQQEPEAGAEEAEARVDSQSYLTAVLSRTLDAFMSMPRERALEAAGAGIEDEDDRDIAIGRARKRRLGEVVLLGELYKRSLIDNDRLWALWAYLSDAADAGAEDDAEAICTLLNTAGEALDAVGGDMVGQFLDRLTSIADTSGSYTSRMRFMAQDLLDMRSAHWVPRRSKVVNPKKLSVIRDIAMHEGPKYTPQPPKLSPRQHHSTGGMFSRSAPRYDDRMSPKTAPRSGKGTPSTPGGQDSTPCRMQLFQGNPDEGKYARQAAERKAREAAQGSPLVSRASFEEEMLRERKLRVERERREQKQRELPKGRAKESPKAPAWGGARGNSFGASKAPASRAWIHQPQSRQRQNSMER